MESQNLVPVTFANQRVLTNAQIAENLQCPINQLKWVYSRHKDQFQEGVHFFNVKGDALHALKKEVANCYLETTLSEKKVANCDSDSSSFALSFAKGAKCIKLWTYQGVARLSKLIDTPKAWELFTALEKNYFNVSPAIAPVVAESAPPAPTRKKPADQACVYVFGMSDNSVKIGQTANIEDRKARIERERGLDVEQEHHSPFMPRDHARRIEKTLHKKYSAVKIGGEFFNAQFNDVAEDIDALAVDIEIVEKEVIEPDFQRERLLVDLLATNIDSPLKEKLFKETANILLGRAFFIS